MSASIIFAFGLSAIANAPLEPVGAWDVHYSQVDCTASRNFGSEADKVRITVSTVPIDDFRKLTIRLAGPPQEASSGIAHITLNNGLISYDLPYSRESNAPSQERVFNVQLSASAVLTPADTDVAEIAIGTQTTRLALRGAKDAFAALEVCNRDLLKHWGLKPHDYEGIAHGPKIAGDVPSQLSNIAFPPEAVRRHAQGKTLVLMTIDQAGVASECRVISSSGDPSLDAATCSAERQLKYVPALDKSGRPTKGYSKQIISWRFQDQVVPNRIPDYIRSSYNRPLR